jgi:hypothetical protein
LRDEGEVGDFLGIRIEKQKGNTFLLTQTGLIDKVITSGGMEDCNKLATTAEESTVGADIDGLPFKETWKYASIVGMLIYLASNTRPDIDYAVHQAARYSYGTKNSQALAFKRIIRYLKGTADKGIIFKPNKSNNIDCHVHSDFAGLFGVEDGLKPICAKSRTGYVISFVMSQLFGCPICKLRLHYQLWKKNTFPFLNL